MRGGGGPFLLRARRSLGEHEQRSKSRMVLKETLSIEALQNEVSLGKFKITNSSFHFNRSRTRRCARRPPER